MLKDDVYGEMLRWFDLIRSQIFVLKDNQKLLEDYYEN